eukprot:TRINITY_DN336_c0_g1_i1.p1 TRINITY_DN336_c0_g1~~TRINITY_DN336_c0_g1_i1.p1  ORF type:complete len:377 (+),score=45.28 TRINITY_DN336_c0_g1_i1:284-1414(+)
MSASEYTCASQRTATEPAVTASACECTPAVACVDCAAGGLHAYFCAPCFALCHASSRSAHHRSMSADTYRMLLVDQELCPSKEEHASDRRHVVCRVDPKTLSLVPGEKLASIRNEAAVLVVSFVAPTGSGKSRLMRPMCGDDKPLPAAAASVRPCSSDVHGYLGKRGMHPGARVVFLDSEGMGGEKIGLESEGDWIRGKGPLFKKEWVSAKTSAVETTYPQLLYATSDVLCFLWRGVPKAHLLVVERLTAIVAQQPVGVAPHLLIVFNCVHENDVPCQDWSVEATTTNFVYHRSGEGCAYRDGMEGVLRFFAGFHVLYIPRFERNPHRFALQLAEMERVITAMLEARVRVPGNDKSGAAWCDTFSRTMQFLGGRSG